MKFCRKSHMTTLLLLAVIIAVCGMLALLKNFVDSRFSGYHTDKARSHGGRLLCLVPTAQGHLKTRWRAVNSTWGPRCDKTLYVMTDNGRELADRNSFLLLPVQEDRTHLTAKVRAGFKHVYDNYIDDFDWILKADDDTYVLVENLRLFLSAYNASEPGYAGLYYRHHLPNKGYMSGGAGYVISRAALRQLVEVGFKSADCPAANGHEDVELGRCLHASGVKVMNSPDNLRKERFNSYDWHRLLLSFPKEYDSQLFNQRNKDVVICSEYAISFHYMSPENMYVYDHLLYKTSVYGRPQ